MCASTMTALLPQIVCGLLLLNAATIQARPTTNNNSDDAALVADPPIADTVQSASDDQAVATTVDLASASADSPDFRIDEAELADYTVHSQAEDGGGSSSSSGGFKLSLLPTPSKTAESVNLEHEGIPSKILSTYDKSQKKLTDLTNPVPIVDMISEHEKYGNNGDMFDGIARSIVNGYEAFSNLLNTIIQKPKDIARSISRGITAQLDIIGGKIVGL